MVVTGEVERGDLKVASVEVALVERDYAVGIIVAEAYRLNPRPPFHELASTDIIAVAGGIALCVRYCGG